MDISPEARQSRLTRPIEVMVTPEQHEGLRAYAQARGLSLSAWIRSLALEAAGLVGD